MVPSIIMASRPGPEDYHTTSTMFDCWYDVLFMKCGVGFMPDVYGTHTFQKVQPLSHQSTEYLPKSLRDNQDIFAKCVTSLCVLFGKQWLLP